MKPIVDAVRLELSMKMTDSPGAIWVIPLRGTECAKLLWLSSILQPVMSTVVAPPLVTSNQSSPNTLLPLDHGATSEIKIVGRAVVDERRATMGAETTVMMLKRMMLFFLAASIRNCLKPQSTSRTDGLYIMLGVRPLLRKDHSCNVFTKKLLRNVSTIKE
jgi:hypothetical protein